MALSGTLVKQISIKSDGNKFFDLFRNKPYRLPYISNSNVTDMALEGILPKGSNYEDVDFEDDDVIKDSEWGTLGSVLTWFRVQDGKDYIDTVVMEAVDEEKKSIVFKVVKGPLMELYKSFLWTIDVDTDGANNSVTWTFTYEKLNKNVEDPNTLMEFWLNVSKDVDTDLLK